ncbi:D-alanyl-D-alanine carboxypeptidase family protein [Fictibacillus iocasae]|uniref:D-alanyl-D-alanine carboxypeptidase family protein n=1 Tax=Fictibacillus iocasae TaxID=2715437 RepID=A0ABW2NU67_9BACL
MNKNIIYLLLGLAVFLLPFHQQAHAEDNGIKLESETAVIMDAKTGNILVDQSKDKQMYPASITKIVTGALAIESGRLDEIVTVSKNATMAEGTRVYLVEGEQVTLRHLVQGLMINSGNDAAVAIAEFLAGDVQSFARQMNDYAKKSGAVSTHFVNPSGLFDENHYTTADDMAKITQHAMQLDEFRQIVGTKELKWDGKEWQTTLQNHHRLLWDYEGTTGVKNGYVDESKHTLVTSVTRGDLDLIIVVMKAPSKGAAYRDTMSLGDYAFAQFERQTLAKGTEIQAEDGKRYPLKEDITITLPKGEKPVQEVTKDGELILQSAAGVELAEETLYSPDKLKKKALKTAENTAGDVKESTFSGSAATVTIFGYAGFLLLMAFMVILRMRYRRRRNRAMRESASRYSRYPTVGK